MAGILSLVTGGKGSGSGSRVVDIAPLSVHTVETDPERRARCLKHLLKGNHVNYSVLYNNNEFTNHNAHILCTAYILGANEVQLNAIYEEQVRELEPWTPSPAEVAPLDWMDFLGRKQYQRAYVDFFEDNLAMEFSYDWKQVVNHFLFSSEVPLVNGLIGGLGHPLIHLAFAFEMDSKELAMEALGLACVQHSILHKYTQDPAYTKQSALATTSIQDLLAKLAVDERIGSVASFNFDKLDTLFDKYEDVILEYWNGWEIQDATKQFEESQSVAVAMLVTTSKPGSKPYNFFLAHVLTTNHAVRTLLPLIPSKYHIPLLRQWWLLTIIVYILKDRPALDQAQVSAEAGGRGWSHVVDKALNSQWRNDSHFVKAIRSMKEAATTWGDAEQYFLRSALTFVDNFDGWSF